MPRLKPIEGPPPPAGGYEPCPIDPNYDRFYNLDSAGEPVRVYDFGVHARWASWEGKGWQIKDMLLDYGVEIWTYFSGWASLRNDDPPVFRTVVKGGGIDKTFNSLTWSEAEDRHRRVIEKVRRTIPSVAERKVSG